MRSGWLLATLCGGVLLVVGWSVAPVGAQESAPATLKAAPQSQPAVPQAYQLDVRNVLAYQVVVTSRAGTAPPTTTKYREMVVFDIDSDENLVVYIGSPTLKAVAAPPAAPAASAVMQPHSTEKHAAPERKPAAAEEPEKVPMAWTRHILGKNFTRKDDGTLSFRPSQGEVMPYPVLPLPPAELKDKERFDLTVPDLAQGEGKTVQVSGQARMAQDGKLTVDCRMEPKVVPGSMPELAMVAYDVPASAAGVSNVRMTRRVALEASPAPAAVEPARPHGERERGARPAAPPVAPTISVLMQLVSTKPVPEDLRRGLINTISTAGHTEEDGASPDKPAATSGKSATGESVGKNRVVVGGNLWEQVEQLGTPNKPKSDAAAK